MIAHGNFNIKNYTNIRLFKRSKQIIQTPSTTRDISQKMNSTSIRKKEPSLNILFLDRNIIDPDEIYITNIYRLP